MISESNGFVVTGGRDNILRIWIIEHEQVLKIVNIFVRFNIFDIFQSHSNLHQELDGHEEYITAIQISRGTRNIFSCDWNGEIFEWNLSDRTSMKYNLLR